MPAPDALADLYRHHHRDVVAPLIRLTGSFELAEDVAHEAFASALESWSRDGVPSEPLAWLRRVARNRAIDRLRRDQRWRLRAQQLQHSEPTAWRPHEPEHSLHDDPLRLLFTCCHPSLSPEAQVALTLHTVCGLDTDAISRAFLVSRETLQQRLVRAKRKIDQARIPYVVPDPKDLPERLATALHTVYLVFNEGYNSATSDVLVRSELCDEAIRLARLIAGLLPERGEPSALLALMLLQHSRARARIDADGALVRLEDQDRGLWDRAAIAEALPLVDRALRARPLPSYAIEAAIAALHAQAPTPDQTDWPQIAALYTALDLRNPGNPVVALNRAVAIALAGDVDGGLARLDALEAAGVLPRYHLLPAARADLLVRAGRLVPAREAYKHALALARNPVEQRFLHLRLAGLEEKITPPVDPAPGRSSGG